ncbi:unnamed protein product [marine sediment metagenome]|uniref:Uncharacterized protein n=1 Tax=marine sediment metagenome TaxID=412755 RepID=X1T8A2_9ZZZZ
MQALVLGKRIEGDLIYIPNKMLSESTIGQIYEVHVRTQGLLGLGGASKENIANIIVKELPKRVPGLKLKWILIEDTLIKIQLEGSPFAWALFLTILPAILRLVGVAVVLIGIYLVWTRIPGWTLGLIVTGILLFYMTPKLGPTLLKPLKELVE